MYLNLDISINFKISCYRRSEFLGCVSFPLKDVIKSDVTGSYFLQGRQAAPAHGRDVTDDRRKMATDNTETSTNDGGKDSQNDKGEDFKIGISMCLLIQL